MRRDLINKVTTSYYAYAVHALCINPEGDQQDLLIKSRDSNVNDFVI